jgi:hypothetical protein
MRRKRQSRWLARPGVWRVAAVVAALLLIGGLGLHTVRSSADAADGFDTIDALANAARIPNDQGPAACPSTRRGSRHQHDHGGKSVAPSAAVASEPAAVPSASAAAPAESIPAPAESVAAPAQAPPASAPAAGECDGHGADPSTSDYIAIGQVQPNVRPPAPGRDASRGSFVSQCGTNTNGHRNPDNFIVAPGVSNGAHHMHDYVGNLSTDGFSTNDSLAAAGTTCRFADRSAYYWPVLRRLGVTGADSAAAGGGTDGNVGRILSPTSVSLQFRGNPRSKVVAMPRFLRIITGDAKAVTNGPANARAQWTCAGFTDRVTTKYPLCRNGQGVQRILDFASCWDGTNVDSANHRAHIVFPLSSGRCPKNTVAVPQLRMTLTYNVGNGRSFAVDTFPEQNHNPLTDHADFANVMSDNLMAFVVSCVNSGRAC